MLRALAFIFDYVAQHLKGIAITLLVSSFVGTFLSLCMLSIGDFEVGMNKYVIPFFFSGLIVLFFSVTYSLLANFFTRKGNLENPYIDAALDEEIAK